MGVSAPVVCLQDVLSNALSDGDLQLDDQHVAADRLQSAAVGELESAGESSGKGEKQDEAEDRWVLCLWVLAKLPSVHHGHGQLWSTPSRIPIDTAAPIGRTVYPTDRPSCTGQLMILPLQWDTLSLLAVRLEGEDRCI